MAHNTKPILVDVNGKPIPQYFDPLADEYKPLLGQHGAARSILYGPDGQPIGTSGNPLQVKAQDTDDTLEQIKTALEALATEDKLEAVRLLLTALESKDFATQTTLVQVKQALDTLTGAVSTSSKQDALNVAVEDLKSELNLVKSELANIKANQLSGDQKVTLSGAIVSVLHQRIEDPLFIGVSGFRFLGVNVQTNRHLVIPIDCSKTKEKAVFFRNDYDVAVNFRVIFYRQNTSGAITFAELPYTNVPAKSNLYLTKKEIDLLSVPLLGIGYDISPSSAPTSGSFTCIIYGGV